MLFFCACGAFDLAGKLALDVNEIRGIVAGVAGVAKVSMVIFDGALQPVERQIPDAVGLDELANFFDAVVGGDQFVLGRRIDAVEAGGNSRRAGNAQMDFAGAGVANHADDLAAGGAADDRIVHQNHALAFKQMAHRVELQLHAEIANGLRGLDESAADIVIADQSLAVTEDPIRAA